MRVARVRDTLAALVDFRAAEEVEDAQGIRPPLKGNTALYRQLLDQVL
jgi:hypothetical protein